MLEDKKVLQMHPANAIVPHDYSLQAATQGLQSLQRYRLSWQRR